MIELVTVDSVQSVALGQHITKAVNGCIASEEALTANRCAACSVGGFLSSMFEVLVDDEGIQFISASLNLILGLYHTSAKHCATSWSWSLSLARCIAPCYQLSFLFEHFLPVGCCFGNDLAHDLVLVRADLLRLVLWRKCLWRVWRYLTCILLGSWLFLESYM